MATKRYPGLAKEMVERQMGGVAGRAPAPIHQMVEEHKAGSGPAFCPACLNPEPGVNCAECGWAMGDACEVCGCTFDNACVDDETGEPCDWIRAPDGVNPGLCTSHGEA